MLAKFLVNHNNINIEISTRIMVQREITFVISRIFFA